MVVGRFSLLWFLTSLEFVRCSNSEKDTLTDACLRIRKLISEWKFIAQASNEAAMTFTNSLDWDDRTNDVGNEKRIKKKKTWIRFGSGLFWFICVKKFCLARNALKMLNFTFFAIGKFPSYPLCVASVAVIFVVTESSLGVQLPR